MKKLYALSGLMVLGLTAYAQQPAIKLSATQLSTIRSAVLKPVAVSLWTVSEDFTATFDTLPAKFDEFSKEVRSQKLDAQMAGAPSSSVMILREDPTGKSEFKVSVGMQVTKKLDVKAPLKIEQVEQSHAIRYAHTGSFQSLSAVHTGIRETLVKNPIKLSLKTAVTTATPATTLNNTSWPVVVRLLNDPRKVAPAAIRTEMIVPTS